MSKQDRHITIFELDTNNLPPLTAEQQATLEALADMPDSGIDYSGIPPQDNFGRPSKHIRQEFVLLPRKT